jgi:tetrahydromethanopterin S-methyltransferase subunit G
MNSNIPSDIEKQNLESHVAANQMRFEHIDENFTRVEDRLNKIERKVDCIQADLKNNNTALIKTIVYSTGTIVTGLLSTIVVVLLKF